VLDEIAAARGVSTTSIALAWVLAQPGVCAIPKAGSVEHVRENRRAFDIELTDAERAAIDAYFKPPRSKRPLEML
jgi:diketogulonate reductase-like aldo/keto reductase